MTNERKAEAKAVVREAAMDEKVVGILLDIQGRVGRIEGKLDSRPCLLHQDELRSLGTRIDAVDARVDEIKEKDIPEFRQALSALDWWSKTRNKVLAALVMALLGVAGAVAGDLIKDALKPAQAKAAEAPAWVGSDVFVEDVTP